MSSSMGDLFTREDSSKGPERAPLAERMRPRSLDEFVGQEHLLGERKPLRRMIEEGRVRSLILWGPPGTGKTTLGRIIAQAYGAEFLHFSAVRASIKEIQQAMERSRAKFKAYGKRDLIFVDELHRFNKAQQAVFLPYVEEGSVILIGATTENPSFEVISPLLSRSQVFVLKPLQPEEIKTLSRRALEDPERGLGDRRLSLQPDAEEFIAQACDGDARRALNLLELAADLCEGPEITLADAQNALQHKAPLYDKAGEEHFNLISAFHKSIRNSEPDAALYWLARMLAAGEDPLYIARRIVRAASEDVGLADPQALPIAIAAKDAYEFMGSPEGELALAEATVYLALAPKSNALYRAFGQAQADVEQTRHEPVPLHIRNPVTKLMKELGYGQGYEYAHRHEEGIAPMSCMPEGLRDRTYYHPTDRGFERELKARLERWQALREKLLKESKKA
jgi:putative ATPase